jgi:hypothetical protein
MFVKKVEYFKEYKLKILFNDDKVKIVDIKPIIINSKKTFKPLMNIEYFKKVSLDNDKCPLGIRWPNDADICPDVLYEIGEEVPQKKTPLKCRKEIRRTVKD